MSQNRVSKFRSAEGRAIVVKFTHFVHWFDVRFERTSNKTHGNFMREARFIMWTTGKGKIFRIAHVYTPTQ